MINMPLPIPPVDPGNPETRLIRAIFGVCPDCDHPDNAHHDGPDDQDAHHCAMCEAS